MTDIDRDPQARPPPAAEPGNALWDAVRARALNDPIWAGTPWLLRRERAIDDSLARDRGA